MQHAQRSLSRAHLSIYGCPQSAIGSLWTSYIAVLATLKLELQDEAQRPPDGAQKALLLRKIKEASTAARGPPAGRRSRGAKRPPSVVL